MRGVSPRQVTLNLGIRPVDARLYPPWAPFGEKNNLLARTSSGNPAFDSLQLVRTAFACVWNMGEFNRKTLGVLLWMAAIYHKTECKQCSCPRRPLHRCNCKAFRRVRSECTAESLPAT